MASIGLVTPVLKIYPPADVSNDFRQISVLPHIEKILERVQLQLNEKDIILRPSQHGFTSGRSTTSALNPSHRYGLMLLTIRVVIKLVSMASLLTLKKPLI